jgi:hypothetical protein
VRWTFNSRTQDAGHSAPTAHPNSSPGQRPGSGQSRMFPSPNGATQSPLTASPSAAEHPPRIVAIRVTPFGSIDPGTLGRPFRARTDGARDFPGRYPELRAGLPRSGRSGAAKPSREEPRLKAPWRSKLPGALQDDPPVLEGPTRPRVGPPRRFFAGHKSSPLPVAVQDSQVSRLCPSASASGSNPERPSTPIPLPTPTAKGCLNQVLPHRFRSRVDPARAVHSPRLTRNLIGRGREVIREPGVIRPTRLG